MICFDITVNGRKVCRAGLGDASVLTCILSWAKPAGANEELRLEVGGLRNPDQDVNSFPKWIDDLKIKPGDKITIEIVESEEGDPPTSEKIEMAADVHEHKLLYFERLKAELGLDGSSEN